MQRHAFITFSIVLIAVSGALAKKEPAIPTTATKPKEVSLVRVNVTGQGYDYFRRGKRKRPFQSARSERFLPKGRVLVTADLVTNQNLRLSVADGRRRLRSKPSATGSQRLCQSDSANAETLRCSKQRVSSFAPIHVAARSRLPALQTDRRLCRFVTKSQ